MGQPHYSTEDFVYNGMYIPKNTTLILNCYDIHHNEEKYTDSYEHFPILTELELTSPICRFSFNPNRYMGDTLSCAESSKLPNAMDRDHWAFGAGWVFYSPFG